MGRVLPTILVALLVAAGALARTTSALGPGALAPYRALTAYQSHNLELVFAPLGPRALARVDVGPQAAVGAARALNSIDVPATTPAQVRLGDMRSDEDLRVGAPATPVYLVNFEGLDIANISPVNGRPMPPSRVMWVCVDARTGRVLWTETY